MSKRVRWCLAGAVGVMAIGWLPWFTWALVEKGAAWAWARFLLRGAVFVDLPNGLIGEAFARTGWVNGFGPFLTIHLLTLGFWFVVLYAVATRSVPALNLYPPNTALQRTRLRAPLSFETFGDLNGR